MDLVLADRGYASFNLMTLAPGWSFVYRDRVCGLFVRSCRTDLIDQITSTPLPRLPDDGRGLCFPGPGR